MRQPTTYLLTALVWLACCPLFGQSARTVSYQTEHLPLAQALDRMGEEHEIDFSYRIDLLNKIKVVYPRTINNPIKVLDRWLSDTNLKYKQFANNRIVIYQIKNRKHKNIAPISKSKKSELTQQTPPNTNVAPVITPTAPPKPAILISGLIQDEERQPLIGASVVLAEDNGIGTVTDVNGEFQLGLDELQGTLVVSYIGYLTQKIPLTSETYLEIILQPDVTALDEVLVVGYGTQRKADVIGAVTSIEVEELNTNSFSNFDAALQGMAAGVSVLSQSGKPGAPSTIRIRGVNSIQSSTEPLWVIDGMPVFSSPNGLGSSNQNPMSLINPNDIESIQVLKDAAATSIYGSRGSNGVIIVTTKSGKYGKGTINVNLSSGISDLTRTPDDVGYVNSQEWFEVMDLAYRNTFGRDFKMKDYYQFDPFAFDEITREQIEEMNINTNWYDEVFRTGNFQEVNVSSSKGTEKSAFYLSANYRSDKGVLDHNQLDRLSLRSNLSFEPLNHFRIDARLNVSHTDNERREDDMTTLIKFSLPWIPIRHPDNPNNYFNPYTNSNIVALNDPANTLNNVKQYRALGNIALQYDLPFVPGLALRSEFSADIIQSNLVDWSSRDIRLDGGKNPSAAAREEAVTFNSINYNAYANYDRLFGLHQISAVGGIEAQRTSQYERILAGEGLVGDYQELGNPRTPLTLDARRNNERYLLGYFGRLNYKFNDKYLAGVSIRRDGSSAFSPSNRWGNFVAVSGGWILSEESFMDFLSADSYLKLRGSYGETGNQSIPNNLQTINFFDRVVYGNRQIGSNGTIPSNLAVDDLSWETTRSVDVGLDYGFLNNRIYGTVSYYHRFIDGMLLEAQLPASAGVSPSREDADFGFLNTVSGEATNKIWSNIGNLSNTGLEFELYTVNFSRKNFKWSTAFNIAFNDNQIRQLTPDLDRLGQGITSSYTISRTGNRRNVWFVADYAGINPDNGVPYIYAMDRDLFEETGQTRRLQDENGKDILIPGTQTNIRENRFIQGQQSSDPTYYGGFTNKFSFFGFDLSAFFSFSGGNYLLDYDRQVAIYPNERRLVLRDILDNSWEERGDETEYPMIVARRTFEVERGQFSSDFGDEDVFLNRALYKADFVRLRNVTLGYTLKPTVLEKMKLSGMRIYGSVNNIWTLTDYPGFDPEGTPNRATNAHILYNNTPIPQLKSFVVGVNVNI